MASEIPEDRIARRAVPLPEERIGQSGDRRAAAAEILRDSEERVAQAQAPGDAADEHRRSDETVDP